MRLLATNRLATKAKISASAACEQAPKVPK